MVAKIGNFKLFAGVLFLDAMIIIVIYITSLVPCKTRSPIKQVFSQEHDWMLIPAKPAFITTKNIG